MSSLSFKDIFLSNLDDAKSSYKYRMTNEVESYITKIYVDEFLKISSKKQNTTIDAMIFLDQLPKTSDTLEYLKFNGDYYFAISGYAPEAFCNKQLNFDHFISIGKYSYFRLHQRIPRDTLFKTLSFDYMQLLLIINQTFDSIKIKKDEQIVSTLDAWNNTRHPIFKRRLIRLGLNPSTLEC